MFEYSDKRDTGHLKNCILYGLIILLMTVAYVYAFDPLFYVRNEYEIGDEPYSVFGGESSEWGKMMLLK